jgi:hypothetical protein
MYDLKLISAQLEAASMMREVRRYGGLLWLDYENGRCILRLRYGCVPKSVKLRVFGDLKFHVKHLLENFREKELL